MQAIASTWAFAPTLLHGKCSIRRGICTLSAHSHKKRMVATPAVCATGGQSQQGLKFQIKKAISSGADVEEIRKLCTELSTVYQGKVADMASELSGAWNVTYSTLGKPRKAPPKPPSEAPPEPSNEAPSPATPKAPPSLLRMLSFGGLPDAAAIPTGAAYNVVDGDAYHLLQCLTFPEAQKLGEVALVLTGPLSNMEHPMDTAHSNQGRVNVHFQQVMLVRSSKAPKCEVAELTKVYQSLFGADKCKEMLVQDGDVLAFGAAIKAPPTYIDVHYIDDEMRVHAGQSGQLYILDRVAVQSVPYQIPRSLPPL